MRVVSWNVNSIRTRGDRLLALLARHGPDVVCLQETKVTNDLFPRDAIEALGYDIALHGQKTYNGVAILARTAMEDVQAGFEGDPLPEHARVIAATIAGVRIYNLYVPNGRSPESEMYVKKLEWYAALRGHLAARYAPEAPVLLVGDFNVAPEARDVHDPKRWAGKIHFTEPERAAVQALMDDGYADLLRLHHDAADIHTWWDYRLGAFHRGWGLRIDLALGTAPIAARCRDVWVDREERRPSSGEGKPSDHAPLVVDLQD